jgi:hypothetical protein
LQDYQKEKNCQFIAAIIAEKQLKSKSHNTINSKNVLQKITTSHNISENESGNCFLLISILVSCLLKNENLWKSSSLYLTSSRQPPPTIPSSPALSPPTSELLGKCKFFHSKNYIKRFIYGKFVNTVQVYLTDVIILRKRKEFHHKIYKVFDILKIYLIIYVYKDRGRKFSIYNLSYRTFYHKKIKNRNNHNKCYLSFCVKKKKIFYYSNVNKRRFNHCCHCCHYCYQHQYQQQQHAHTSSIQMNSNGICCRNFLFSKQQFSIYVTTTTTTTETARYFYVYLFKRRFPLRKVNLKLPMKAELFVLLFIFRIDGGKIKCLVKNCCVLIKNRNFHNGIEFSIATWTQTIVANKLSYNCSVFSISYALLSIKVFINVFIRLLSDLSKFCKYCENFFIFLRISLTGWQAAAASFKRLHYVGYHHHHYCNHHQYHHQPPSINLFCLDFLNLFQTTSNNGNTFEKIYSTETIRKATTNNTVEEILPKAKKKKKTKTSNKNNGRNNGNWKNRSNNSSLANKNINKFINKIFSVLLNKKKTDLFNDDIEMDCLCSGRDDESVGGRGRNVRKNLLEKYNPQNNKFWQIVIITIFMICTPIITASSVHNGNNNMKYSTDVVKTKYGPLRGIMLRANPPVEAFLGVPYATPPLGSLRWVNILYITILIDIFFLKHNISCSISFASLYPSKLSQLTQLSFIHQCPSPTKQLFRLINLKPRNVLQCSCEKAPENTI